MNVTLTLSLRSNRPGCPPISCGEGGAVAFELKPDSVAKGRDGSGWLIGAISAKPYPLNTVGPSDWVYQIAFPETELSDEVTEGTLPPLAPTDMHSGDGAVGLCCLTCGSLMLLDKLLAIRTRALSRESFRIFEHDTPHVVGLHRIFRNHSAIQIFAVEASVEEHLFGYPYAENPQPVRITLSRTPVHQSGPFTDADPSELVIDPASATPLTGRIEFVPPLEIPAGAALGINLNETDPEAHLGLEIHLDFRVIDED